MPRSKQATLESLLMAVRPEDVEEDAWEAYLDLYGGPLMDVYASEHFRECYRGHYESWSEFAQEYIDLAAMEAGVPADWLDLDQVIDDLMMSGYVGSEIPGKTGVHIFDTNF